MYYVYNSTNFNMYNTTHNTTLKSKIKIPYEKRDTFFTKYMKYINKKFTKNEEDDENDVVVVILKPGWTK